MPHPHPTPPAAHAAAPDPRAACDELDRLMSRCACLAGGLELILSGSGLPYGLERDRLCQELTALIEETARHASRLLNSTPLQGA